MISMRCGLKSNECRIDRLCGYFILYLALSMNLPRMPKPNFWVILVILKVLVSPVISAAPATDPDSEKDETVSRWEGRWIGPAGGAHQEYGVYLFRKQFDLESKPSASVPIKISADNRYLLFVNGHKVARGPSRGDYLHWRYETIDIAPIWLKEKI